MAKMASTNNSQQEPHTGVTNQIEPNVADLPTGGDSITEFCNMPNQSQLGLQTAPIAQASAEVPSHDETFQKQSTPATTIADVKSPPKFDELPAIIVEEKDFQSFDTEAQMELLERQSAELKPLLEVKPQPPVAKETVNISTPTEAKAQDDVIAVVVSETLTSVSVASIEPSIAPLDVQDPIRNLLSSPADTTSADATSAAKVEVPDETSHNPPPAFQSTSELVISPINEKQEKESQEGPSEASETSTSVSATHIEPSIDPLDVQDPISNLSCSASDTTSTTNVEEPVETSLNPPPAFQSTSELVISPINEKQEKESQANPSDVSETDSGESAEQLTSSGDFEYKPSTSQERETSNIGQAPNISPGGSTNASTVLNTSIDSSSSPEKPKRKRRSFAITPEPQGATIEGSGIKRARTRTQLFQSPATIGTRSGRTTSQSDLEESSSEQSKDESPKDTIEYGKYQILAVRSDDSDFYICRTTQNSSSERLKVEWLDTTDNRHYKLTKHYDNITSASVLAELFLQKLRSDKKRQFCYVLDDDSRNIIMKALRDSLRIGGEAGDQRETKPDEKSDEPDSDTTPKKSTYSS